MRDANGFGVIPPPVTTDPNDLFQKYEYLITIPYGEAASLVFSVHSDWRDAVSAFQTHGLATLIRVPFGSGLAPGDVIPRRFNDGSA